MSENPQYCRWIVIACLCGLLLPPAGGAANQADEETRKEKFEELEKEYGDNPAYLTLTKASWLTKQGNRYGRQGKLDAALDLFREAIELRNDYFPAYVSLALAYRQKEEFDKAIDTIEKAPETMSVNGNEIGGFEYDVYYVKMLVYSAIPDHDEGVKAAREGLEVLDDSKIKARRQRAEKTGVVGPGSGDNIIETLEKYVKIREARGDG